MTEPTPAPSSQTPPAVTPPVAPSATPAPAPVAAVRPEWLPESHWDVTASSIKPEFGTHYAELKSFQEAEVARKAALPQKPEDYKLEPIIPEGLTLPPGLEIKFDPKDPETASLLAFAHESGLSQDQVNKYVENDIRVKLARHNAEMARIEADDAKLGANAKDRKAAVGNWLKGMKDRNELSADEYEAVRVYAIDAASVTALEKNIPTAAGSVPGAGGGNDPPKPAEVPLAQRWYGSTSQKAS